MLKKPLEPFEDKDQREILEHILQEAQGKTIDLDAIPTASDPLLEDGERGEYNNILYLRHGETIYVITPSSTISITG